MRTVFILAMLGLGACSTTEPAAVSPSPATSMKAAAPAAAPATPVAVAADADDPNKKICRRITQTGSNYPKKFCSTKAEWAAADAALMAQSEQIEAARNRADTSTVGRAR